MEIQDARIACLSSFMVFLTTFFELKTGRPFTIVAPIGRKSHYLVIAEELELVFDLKTNRLIINVPPGHAKSTMVCYFIAWAMAKYPDCNFLYISYGYDLAEKHTHNIKQIMSMPTYEKMFGVYIDKRSAARGNFRTTSGGSVVAFGSSGSITGQDAGLPYLNRFSGMVVIDDAHKPGEVFSDTVRGTVIDNYNQTIKPRPRSDNVPIVFIGQRLHEDDLPAFMAAGKDGFIWKKVILKAIDEAGNALCPAIKSLKQLRIEEEFNPYVFSSQYQQDPLPAGGGLFKPEWFVILEETPIIIETFITIDTAETDKSYNDATVFSFWGTYKILLNGVDTGLYGLHWLDCSELRIEPKDLQDEFFDFYAACMRFSVKPKFVAIEKKSTGVTLSSVLKSMQGLRIIDIERTKASGNKTTRFVEMQPFASSRRISFTRYAKHVEICLEHMRKITANDSHRHDDIADTLYDAVKIALIDNTLLPKDNAKTDSIMLELSNKYKTVNAMRASRRW